MSIAPVVRAASSLAARPLGAIAVSLATVLGFTALLGVVFLPHELLQVANHPPQFIVDHHVTMDNQGAVVLTKWMAAGQEGRFRHRVDLHDWADGGPARLLVPDSCQPQVLAVDDLGDRLFVGTADQRILVVNLRTHDEPALFGNYRDGALEVLRTSPDGAMLLAGGTSGLVAWTTVDGAKLWSRPDLGALRWVIDPSSSCLLVDTRDGRLLELEMQSGRTLRLIVAHDPFSAGLAVSADGRRIARVGGDCRVEMIDRATGRLLWPEIVPPRCASRTPRALEFSPCGRWLVAPDACDWSCLVVWSTATGQRQGELRGHLGPVVGLQFTAAGTLYSWGLDGAVCTWRCRADGNFAGAPLVSRPLKTQRAMLADGSARGTAAGMFSLGHRR
ncbi:MAG: hypothetical protein L0211_11435 [Planctomycetaceae bacterium]|nr:hypothetical protein [Planctomycetaceae bacterium]